MYVLVFTWGLYIVCVCVESMPWSGGFHKSTFNNSITDSEDKCYALHHVVACPRLLFNDAEVKPFDASQLAIECFGGEMTVSGSEWHLGPNSLLTQFSSK